VTHLFGAGDRVDVLIPGAVVVSHGATQIQVTLPGISDRTVALPIRDERAREVVEVTVAVPRPVAGEVYLIAGAADRRLFAFNDPKGRVALLDPADGESYWAEDAVVKFGQLHLSIPMPEPEQPARARASVPMLSGATADGLDPVS
jgi:hypothetical protein